MECIGASCRPRPPTKTRQEDLGPANVVVQKLGPDFPARPSSDPHGFYVCLLEFKVRATRRTLHPGHECPGSDFHMSFWRVHFRMSEPTARENMTLLRLWI
jgi:hypothetical protein